MVLGHRKMVAGLVIPVVMMSGKRSSDEDWVPRKQRWCKRSRKQAIWNKRVLRFNLILVDNLERS